MGIKVAVLTGSLRDESLNWRLAKALVQAAPDGMEFEHLKIDEVPYYDQDDEADMPDAVSDLKRRIAAADALMFVTPEYNRSIPGVLKNAIDWASRPYGQNSFAGKPALVAGTSPGPLSTGPAQQHLRTILSYLDVYPLGQPEVFIHFKDDLIDQDGNVSVDSTAGFFRDVMQEFRDHITRMT